MDQGVAALAGAAIGGAAAALAAVIAGRAARHQARSQERIWRNETRREIYTTYYAALHAAIGASHAMAMQAIGVVLRAGSGRDAGLAQIEQERSPERQQERDEAGRLVAELTSLHARVVFEGPSSVREVAKELVQTVHHDHAFCLAIVVPHDGEPPAHEYLSAIREQLASTEDRLSELAERFLTETTRVLDGEIAP
ncbi:hypothetical protein ACF05L_13845 [Streptomyces bobili]|uniref:hypothetical protein n=1 Tax=Streptomyces bobili TaxID=67280 RepID=UPI0036FA1035